MAEDIKRVGLEFTAEGVSDFKSQLQAVTQASQENYKAFKKAKEGYDSNTSASKKLGDRQKYLTSQTEAYKKKVEVLSSQLEEMENDENANEKAIAKKRAALEKAKGTLSKYESQLEEVNSELEKHNVTLEKWQESLGRMGEKATKVGGALTKGVTALFPRGKRSTKPWTPWRPGPAQREPSWKACRPSSPTWLHLFRQISRQPLKRSANSTRASA